MEQLVECVLNFSEGRDTDCIQAIAGAVDSCKDVFLLDCSSDVDHHRSVLTFVGQPEPVVRGALSVFKEAIRRIDLNYHRGVHPRIGAVDVVPFVPLRAIEMKDCVRLARRFGEIVSKSFAVPVFLYGAAAARSERSNLSTVRHGQFEGLRASISRTPELKPDYGEACLHPTAGACAVGARGLLIAFNIFLNSDELKVAREVARSVRESSGGLPGLLALGLFLERRGQVQVSMNLTNFRVTSLYRVFERVASEAAKRGCRVTSSEIVGLVPKQALKAGDPRNLLIENFSSRIILEDRYHQVTGREW